MSAPQIRLHSNQIVTLPPIPELFDAGFLDILLPPAVSENSSGKQDFEQTASSSDTFAAASNPLINNRATTPKSTGSATLAAFNGLNARSRKSLNSMDVVLHESWVEDPELTLKIIWNMRSIHDGKGEKELFYRAFGWLYEHHPRTALFNLHMVVKPVCAVSETDLAPHGYWKDLLNILALATCDELLDFHSRRSNFLHTYTLSDASRSTQYRHHEQARQRRIEEQERYYERLAGKLTLRKYRALYIAVARLFADQIRKDIAVLNDLLNVGTTSLRELHQTRSRMVSLAGKWAPNPGGSHDRVTNLSTAICQLLFSSNENIGPGAINPLPSSTPYPISTDKDNCFTLRNYYHRWILKPLRELIGCPEPLMSANKWREIQYSRVQSLCMSRNKPRFILHDPEGFQLYLAGIRNGKKKIGTTTLMPHELLGKVIALQKVRDTAPDEVYPRIAEFQLAFAEQQLDVADAHWRALIFQLKGSGHLEGTLAICDVSPSMGSIYDYDEANPNSIVTSVALSLALASTTTPPFDSSFITFSTTPELLRVHGLEQKKLTTLVNEIAQTRSGTNIDLQAVFLEVLLPLAKENDITRENMAKRIVVFSDKQFDHAVGIVTGPWWLNRTLESERADRWEMIYSLIEKRFEENGYQVPEIVFWDLAGDRAVRQMVEPEVERRGVVMMSGFSDAMMKAFLYGKEEIDENLLVEEVVEEVMTPMELMKRALRVKSYDGLVVID